MFTVEPPFLLFASRRFIARSLNTFRTSCMSGLGDAGVRAGLLGVDPIDPIVVLIESDGSPARGVQAGRRGGAGCRPRDARRLHLPPRDVPAVRARQRRHRDPAGPAELLGAEQHGGLPLPPRRAGAAEGGKQRKGAAADMEPDGASARSPTAVRGSIYGRESGSTQHNISVYALVHPSMLHLGFVDRLPWCRQRWCDVEEYGACGWRCLGGCR